MEKLLKKFTQVAPNTVSRLVVRHGMLYSHWKTRTLGDNIINTYFVRPSEWELINTETGLVIHTPMVVSEKSFDDALNMYRSYQEDPSQFVMLSDNLGIQIYVPLDKAS